MRELIRTRTVPIPAADRPRRLRRTAALRSLVKETRLAPGQLVMPMFVISGRDRAEPIESLPGHARLSVDRAVARSRELAHLGVGGVLLFGIPDRKDDDGTGAYDAAGPVPSALRALREADLPLVLAADVCMCEYTSHGHCGVIANGQVDARLRRPARLPDGLLQRPRGDARDGSGRAGGRRHPHRQACSHFAGSSGSCPQALRRTPRRLSRQRRGRDAGGRRGARLARPQIRWAGDTDSDRARGGRDRHHLPGGRCRALAARGPGRLTEQYVHALALGLDPAWRRLPDAQRRSTCADFVSTIESATSITNYAYTMVGLQAGIDLVLWRLAPSLDALEESAAAALRCGMGTWMSVKESFLGLIQPSQYVKKPTPQEQSLFSGERSRYLIVYPFTKSADWYLLDKETRQRVMNEHMKVGHQYPQVRQLLAYSFGLDDQDFVVAYETDDLPAFGALVRALRSTESRRSTVRDTPILAGIHRGLGELAELLGA